MVNRKRQGNNPKRRIAVEVTPQTLASLSKVRYSGSALHKTKLADYDFNPPVNPRPKKSVCDDLRVIGKIEAVKLFRAGIARHMVSTYLINGLPKYVWAVDDFGEPYESKLSKATGEYYGYRLSEDKDGEMRSQVIKTWESRN